MSYQTRPQYQYRPTVEGDFTILSIVYGGPGNVSNMQRFENYVAHCGNELQAIALIARLYGLDDKEITPLMPTTIDVSVEPWVDKRPANCRNRQRDEGKAYPRSGCESCKNGGLMGCPHEKKEPRTSNDVR